MRRLSKEGFSLIELMIVIAVMGILAAIAAPNLRNYMADRRLGGAAREVMTDLMLARMQAVNQNKRVGFALIDNHRYQIFADNNQNGSADSGETVMTKDIHPDYYDVTFTSTTTPVFIPNGTVFTATNGTVTVTNYRGSKQVTTSSAGRVRIS